MIRIGVTEAGFIEIGQEWTSPAVYLDHWALRAISEQPSLAARFSDSIKRRRGVLALSATNLLEFANVQSPQQADMADRLLDSVFPYLFFLDSNAFVVINREEQARAGTLTMAPQADTAVLAMLPMLKPESLAPLTVRGLLRGLSQPPLQAEVAALADTFSRKVDELRSDVAADPSLAAIARTVPDPGSCPPTHLLLREFVRPLASDSRKRITRSDALDFFHAVVPVSYCDYVLLDRHWAAQVRQIEGRFRHAGVERSLACVLTGAAGIEELLQTLERADI